MYHKRLASLVAGMISVLSSAFAQTDLIYYNDALQYSQVQPFGTARFQAMGGVNQALGGDLTSLAGNPAGLGVYNKSEIGISMGIGVATPTTNYFGSNTRDNRNYLYFPNLGIVFSGDRDKVRQGGFRGGSFGIGLTRLSNFQNEFMYSGLNTSNSMTDYFYGKVNGTTNGYYASQKEYNNLDDLAYWTFLVEPDTQSDTTRSYYTWNQGYPSNQRETVLTRGAINQWNFTYGANFNDNIYIGASLGIPMIRYISEKNYQENVLNNDVLKNFRLDDNLTVKGTGVNFKLGLITKPADWIRLGISFQTPTFYSISETYYSYLKAVYKVNMLNDAYGTDLTSTNGVIDATTTTGINKYNLVSPFRIGGGIALFKGKSGFISADLEYVPYNFMYLKEKSLYATAGNSTFTDENQMIRNVYKPTVNVKIGGELRKDIYRFRLGFASLGDPFNNVIEGVSRRSIFVTAGAGIKLDDYYVDVALVNSRAKSTYYPYQIYPEYTSSFGNSPVVNLKNVNTSLIISTGFYF